MGHKSCTIRMAGSNRSTHPSPCLASGLMPAHMPPGASSQQSSPWCPNRMYLQVSGEGDQVERGMSRRLHEDSSHSRRFPLFHLKIRADLAQFTTKSVCWRFQSLSSRFPRESSRMPAPGPNVAALQAVQELRSPDRCACPAWKTSSKPYPFRSEEKEMMRE
jgi:hypothetical protein